MLTRTRQTALIIFCLIAVTVSSAIFYVRIKNEYSKPFSYDLLIFAKTSQQFWETGTLYTRSDDLAETYKPGAPTYKFPPAHLLWVAPWVSANEIPAHLQSISRIATLLLYMASITWLCLLLTRHFSIQKNLPLWLALAWSHAALSLGFIKAFDVQNAEVLFLFLFTVSLAMLQRRPAISGAAIGIAASGKLYPAFMIGSAILSASRKSWLTGLIIATAALLLMGLLTFGMKENIFYFMDVLPTLLGEPFVNHPHNVSLSTFMFNYALHGDINTAQHFASTLKAIVITGSALTLWWCQQKPLNPRRNILLYSYLMTGMLLFMPNYWPQYYLLLIIPIFAGNAILISQSRWIALMLWNLVALSIHIDPAEIWLITHLYFTFILNNDALRELPNHISTIELDALLYQHSRLSWVVNRLIEHRMLAPLILWISLAYLSMKPDKKVRPLPVHAANA